MTSWPHFMPPARSLPAPTAVCTRRVTFNYCTTPCDVTTTTTATHCVCSFSFTWNTGHRLPICHLATTTTLALTTIAFARWCLMLYKTAGCSWGWRQQQRHNFFFFLFVVVNVRQMGRRWERWFWRRRRSRRGPSADGGNVHTWICPSSRRRRILLAPPPPIAHAPMPTSSRQEAKTKIYFYSPWLPIAPPSGCTATPINLLLLITF